MGNKPWRKDGRGRILEGKAGGKVFGLISEMNTKRHNRSMPQKSFRFVLLQLTNSVPKALQGTQTKNQVDVSFRGIFADRTDFFQPSATLRRRLKFSFCRDPQSFLGKSKAKWTESLGIRGLSSKAIWSAQDPPSIRHCQLGSAQRPFIGTRGIHPPGGGGALQGEGLQETTFSINSAQEVF